MRNCGVGLLAVVAKLPSSGKSAIVSQCLSGSIRFIWGSQEVVGGLAFNLLLCDISLKG